jgi:hypothetical protein
VQVHLVEGARHLPAQAQHEVPVRGS